MENSARSRIVAESEGHGSVGSKHRVDFVNMEPRGDRAQAQSLSIRASPVQSDHISWSHFVLLRQPRGTKRCTILECKFASCDSSFIKGYM